MLQAIDVRTTVEPRVRSILNAGVDLCRERGMVVPHTRDAVWALLRESAWVVEAVPDAERRWRRGLRACWPYVTVSAQDVLAARYERLRSGMELSDAAHVGPTPEQISRAEVVMGWWQVIVPPRRCPIGRSDFLRLIHALALGVSVTTLSRRYGVGRSTIYRWRDHAVEQIVAWLHA